jgi:hypothetical protein
VEHPLVEHPLVEHPLVEHPLVEHPLVEHPLVEHPLVERPLVERPLSEHPSAEHPLRERQHERDLSLAGLLLDPQHQHSKRALQTRPPQTPRRPSDRRKSVGERKQKRP